MNKKTFFFSVLHKCQNGIRKSQYHSAMFPETKLHPPKGSLQVVVDTPKSGLLHISDTCLPASVTHCFVGLWLTPDPWELKQQHSGFIFCLNIPLAWVCRIIKLSITVKKRQMLTYHLSYLFRENTCVPARLENLTWVELSSVIFTVSSTAEIPKL